MGVCLLCLIFLVVKLLTGFEACVSSVKYFTLDGASVYYSDA